QLYKCKRHLQLSIISFVLIMLALFVQGEVQAQDKPKKEEFNVIKGQWLQFSDAPNSLYRHFSAQAYNLLSLRSSQILALKSLSDWKARQQSASNALMDIVGPFPEKTPLNAKVLR